MGENMLAKEIADGSKESLSSSLDSSAGRTSQKHVEKGKNADVVGSEIRPDAQPMLRGKGRKTLRRWLREWRGRGDHQCWICIARLWREGEAWRGGPYAVIAKGCIVDRVPNSV